MIGARPHLDPHQLPTSVSGLVVKSIVAIDGPRVRFAADALFLPRAIPGREPHLCETGRRRAVSEAKKAAPETRQPEAGTSPEGSFHSALLARGRVGGCGHGSSLAFSAQACRERWLYG